MVAAVSVFAGASLTSAQQPVDWTSPTSVVQHSIEAGQRLDFKAFVSYVHPAELDAFKAILWDVLEQAAAKDTLGAADEWMNALGLHVENGALVDVPSDSFMVHFMTFVTTANPTLAELMKTSTFEIIGQVAEGDSLIHVVTRVKASVGEMTSTQMDVETLRRYNDGWRLTLRGQMEGLAEEIAAQMRRGL